MSRPSRRPLDRDLYDAVVAEAKSRFDVWPSAYASGWVVKTYKARGGRYAGGDRKTRSGLTKWFGESWVDLSRPIHDEDGELVGYEPCGRKASDDPAAYPKCRPLAEAMRMSPREVKDAIKRKRAAEAKAGRGGARGRGGRGARAPVRVSTYRKNPDARERFLDATTPEEQIVALAAWHAADPDDVARNHPAPSFVKREFTPEFFTMFVQAVNDGDAEAIEAIASLHDRVLRRLRPSDEQRAQKRAEREIARYERQGVEIDTSARNPLAKLKGRSKRVWLYHGTSSLFLDDILQNGLRPSMEHGQTSNIGAKTFAKASPEYVFLTASPSGTASAEFYAKYAARQHGGEPVVLRVLVDADELAYDPDDADLSVGRTQFVIDHVDPQQIKEVDGVRVGSPSARANPDDEQGVVLYHRTTPANAAKIVRERRWMSREQPPFVFFSTDPYGHGTSYGEALLEVVVPEDVARLDDEFPSGEQHYAVLTRDLAGLPVRLVEARANPYDPEDDPLSDVYVIATDELEDGTVVKYVASPFPYERKPLGHRDDSKVQGLVNLATLIGTQRRVSVAGVEKYLGDAERPPRPGSSRMPAILVYETSDGRQYIADGHHRAVAALIRGLETFPAIIQLVRE